MLCFSNPELDTIENELAHVLPGLYRKLLVEIGFGEHGDIEIYNPLQIRELYQFHFDDTEELFNKYFPFGCNNRSQEIWLIRVEDETVASIWHETHPDDYPDQHWVAYEEWLAENDSLLPA